MIGVWLGTRKPKFDQIVGAALHRLAAGPQPSRRLRDRQRVPTEDTHCVLWDAPADAMARSAAAETVAGGPLFSAVEPQQAARLRAWLVETERAWSRGLGSGCGSRPTPIRMHPTVRLGRSSS